MSKTFVAIGPFCWGKGTTEAEAVKNCRAHSPGRWMLSKGRHPINVYRVDGKFLHVDGVGRIHYKGTLTQLREVKACIQGQGARR